MTRSTLVAWMPSSRNSRVAASRIRPRALLVAMAAPAPEGREWSLSCKSLTDADKLCKYAECTDAESQGVGSDDHPDPDGTATAPGSRAAPAAGGGRADHRPGRRGPGVLPVQGQPHRDRAGQRDPA